MLLAICVLILDVVEIILAEAFVVTCIKIKKAQRDNNIIRKLLNYSYVLAFINIVQIPFELEFFRNYIYLISEFFAIVWIVVIHKLQNKSE